MTLKEKLSTLPEKPGVYLFKDAQGNILYVGKAVVLWNRVHSYFQKESAGNPRLQLLISKIHDLEYFLCDSELEAFLLEYNLIKEHHPPFNVQFRDDKRFPLIKLVLTDPFPYLTIARRREKDGNRYFGPYVSSHDMRQTLKIIRKIFQIRSCTMNITGHDRVCLYYHLKECSAPCILAVSREDYMRKVEEVIEFLEGKRDPLIGKLKQEMEEAAQRLEFEKAARIRNQIQSLEIILTKQKVARELSRDEDYVGIASEKGLCAAEIFHVRQGNLVRKEQFIFESAESDQEESLSAFIRQHYQEIDSIPSWIFVSRELEDLNLLEKFLSHNAGHPVHLEVPKRGEKKKMISLLEKNAAHDLSSALLKEARTHGKMEILENLQKLFKLPRLPFRIEGYDISTLYGKESVGSMVVFAGGKPEKKHYRRFSIQGKSTPDDFAMMEEMLMRRLERLKPTEEDESFASAPDLILIDGGQGQLSVGMKALQHFKRDDIPVLSIAKKEEEIYHPNFPRPLKLSRTNPGLNLLRHVRDEAHRFAVTYHKNLRDKKITESSLEAIPGIGKKRAQKLLENFGSINQIKVADPALVANVLKCSKVLAEKIVSHIDSF